ncbi:MAG: DUF1003 domain-containing protein [Stigonema ocellatum SAG 48.90 = DSM 106950]|nr:DUF1003 domain-containing protein [Stigonema ocellatum SAG 48.90 = DSM 106950]
MKTSRKPDEKKSSQESQGERSQNILPTAPLPEHISQNIDSIIALRKRHEQDVSRHQRFVETVTAFFGRPAFLYSILLGIILWVTPNALPRRFGLPRFDPPPFPWLGFSLTVGSLLVTTGVLITQNRQEQMAEQRAQLNLQLSLLSEQKIAKLIDLVEELRRDLPDVKNRHDPEAETMKQAADPHAVMVALEETLRANLAVLHKQDTSENNS